MGEALISRRGGGGGGVGQPTIVYTSSSERNITNLAIEPGVYHLYVFTINYQNTVSYTRFIADEYVYYFETDGSSVKNLSYTGSYIFQQKDLDYGVYEGFTAGTSNGDKLTVANGKLNFTCGSRYDDYDRDRQVIRLLKVG